MFNKQIKMNVEKLDIMIGKLLYEVDELDNENAQDAKLQRLEKLIDLRSKMGSSKEEESNKVAIVSGIVQVAGILVVLQYEKANVITSKAYQTAVGMFRK